MRLWLSMLMTALLTLLLPLSASAQTMPGIDHLKISLWSEYDKPAVLVIYHISLSSTASLPAEVNVRIPQAVGKPNAVAMQDVDGTLVDLNYSTTASGEWSLLTFTTPVPNVQIEYYDTRLSKDGAKRSYQYRWSGDQPVAVFEIEVLQPVGASQLEVTPQQQGTWTQAPDGLKYYNISLGSVNAGAGFTLNITYKKINDALSYNPSNVQPAAPIDNNTPGRLTFQEILPWLLGLVGLILITGGALWYWQSGRERRAVPEGRRRHAQPRVRESAAVEGTGAGTNAGAIYCHQCGRRANSGDVFCRTCGTRLRS